ncbi:MAG TPA: sigma-70 family RNA polymerase sigma factor [Candidatus Tumulicola sp.]
MCICNSRERVDRCFRDDAGRTVATLSRVLGDIDLAEDVLQEAYLTALERWPRDGFPTRPSAWILTTARNAAINRLNRERTGRDKAERAALLERAIPVSDVAEDDDDMNGMPDDRLGLIFACCHPALNVESRIALTLRTLAGMSTTEIADALLVAHATMAQRLVRVKRKIRDTRVAFAVPAPERLPERLNDVCTVLYLIFNEGYTATSGDSLMRHDLCDEATRLCRVLAALMPAEPEVLGLLALMLYTDARRDARVGADGSLVLLADQDRGRWNGAQIAQANRALEEAEKHRVLGSYLLQAQIAREHSVTSATDVDWWKIAKVYEQLEALQPSPVIALNRAVAIGFACGPVAALALLDALPRGELDEYYPFHLARGDALERIGRVSEAIAAYELALERTQNVAQQRHLRSLIAKAR